MATARISRQQVEALGTEYAGIRISRQQVEALGTEYAGIRISRQIVEVLGTPAIFVDVSSTLSLGQSTEGERVKPSGSSLDLSQGATATRTLPRGSSSVLGMTQGATVYKVSPRDVSSVLEVTQEAAYTWEGTRGASSDIDVSQGATVYKTVQGTTSSELVVTQEATYSKVSSLTATSELELTQEATHDPLDPGRVTTELSLGQSIQVTLIPGSPPPPLTLNHEHYGTIYEAAAYFAGRLHDNAWSYANVANRPKALMAATIIIDSLNFKGQKVTEDQALEFPRDDDTEVPEAIRKATYEISRDLLDGKDPELELENLGIVSQGFASVGTSYARNKVPIEHIINGVPSPLAWRLLKPFLRDDDAIKLSRVS